MLAGHCINLNIDYLVICSYLPIGIPGSNKVSTMTQYDSVGTMWQYSTTSGLPGQGQSGPSPVSDSLLLYSILLFLVCLCAHVFCMCVYVCMCVVCV